MADDQNITTVAAIATPPGIGGVGIVRVSGPLARQLGEVLTGVQLRPRLAHYGPFSYNSKLLDKGIALFFQAPHSFTGEDILELHGHGGRVVMDRLLQAVVHAGAELAPPGEFSKRAYLNGKIDLAQAEAVADLINSSSEQAASAALASLEGVFSSKINLLLNNLTHLRKFVEASIDFPEEEIDFLADANVVEQLDKIQVSLEQLLQKANRGVVLKEGLKVVLMGQPNVGKSTLLNALAGKEAAIVTSVAGTTRDILTEHIHLDGLPLHIIDTAGLRLVADVVEKEGIRRAEQAIAAADKVIFVVDNYETPWTTLQQLWPDYFPKVPAEKLIVCCNKIDLSAAKAQVVESENITRVYCSADTLQGFDLLVEVLKKSVGYVEGESVVLARRRHLSALEQTLQHVVSGRKQLESYNAAELLAEELLLAQNSLAEITGELTADDLLGEIFAGFCIGK